MLSIIVSNKNKCLFEQLAQNIKLTVGCEYELLQIENINRFGICEAYNQGIKMSNFNTICFIHEDIIFHTDNWGKTIVNLLKDETIGLIGIAGSKYLSTVPGMWNSWYSHEKTCTLNILQNINGEIIHQQDDWSEKKLTDVVVCDGVFLCTRRNVVINNQFDNVNLTKFHFYDMDLSLSIYKNYRVCVTHEILIEHLSSGKIDNSWAHEALVFKKKWSEKLPISIDNFDYKIIELIEKRIKTNFCDFIIGYIVKNRFSFDWIILLRETTSLSIFLNAFFVKFLRLFKILQKNR